MKNRRSNVADGQLFVKEMRKPDALYKVCFPYPNHFSPFLARRPRHPFKALATSERRGRRFRSFRIFPCRAPEQWVKRRTALLSLLPELFRLADRMHTLYVSLVHLGKLVWRQKVYADAIPMHARAILKCP